MNQKKLKEIKKLHSTDISILSYQYSDHADEDYVKIARKHIKEMLSEITRLRSALEWIRQETLDADSTTIKVIAQKARSALGEAEGER